MGKLTEIDTPYS